MFNIWKSIPNINKTKKNHIISSTYTEKLLEKVSNHSKQKKNSAQTENRREIKKVIYKKENPHTLYLTVKC